MLWLRGLIFTALVPFIVGYVVPQSLRDTGAAPGAWQLGYILFAVGAALYLWCLVCFLMAGGTPAIFFTRHLGFLLGKEPPDVVRTGPYRYSRNPMYVGVLLILVGEAALFGSRALLIYAMVAGLAFHLAVILYEEPHLTRIFGQSYRDYCAQVPRWPYRIWPKALPSKRGCGT